MAFNKGFEGLKTLWPNIAMKVTSLNRSETYGWMNTIPGLEEWIGPRNISNLRSTGFTLMNRDFQQTIGVPRNDILDDSYGLYAPLFQEMGRAAAELPDKLVAELLLGGWDNDCYDGQRFFDVDHPVEVSTNQIASVANTDNGSGEPWFLIDTSRAMLPLIYQERQPFGVLISKDRPEDDNVFMNKEFLYGSDGRGNAGYGLWQLIWGSKQTLNAENYLKARVALTKMIGDNGRKLGIRPTTLLVGPENEGASRKLLFSEHASGGETNEWKDSASLIVSPWIG